ncbi:sodium pump decarboxylase gamma subunit [Christensenella timonensis]|nr:sodium pump decarboxylase gamma subunit [Christensenella timonensis]
MNEVLINSLDLMWKGMLSIFVVIAAICIVVMIMNRVTRKKKQKE